MNTFKSGTKNSTIFESTAPYRNPYQGNAPRWLFVCSAGLLRSPTGATLASNRGINARSCGSNLGYALIPCTANLIRWADKIVFVNRENYSEVVNNFEGYSELTSEIASKAKILDIPDNYDYMNEELQRIYEAQLFKPEGY
jgi:predicted protein tyrosine phosphatase